MNKVLNIVCIAALLAVLYSEVSARSYKNLPRFHRPPVRIVNGTDAEEGEFPYVVQVRDEYGFFMCGGAIIGQKWVLTAGHCVDDDVGSIVYGTNILYDNRDTDTVIKVKKSYQHPKFAYNFTHIGGVPLYDVGILELEEEIPFSDKAQPIKLADTDNVPFHVDGVLAGWGVNDTYGDAEPYLQKIKLQLLTDLECAREIADYAGYDIFNGTHNLCSDDYWNGECYGDSGSPFVINGTQYGIVSWSLKPCGSNPGTYSRISNPEYREFVTNVTGI